MKIINPYNPALSYRDVSLVPRHSSIPSRFDGTISTISKITSNITLNLPIISAKHLLEFAWSSQFVRQTPQAYIEGTPHGQNRSG